ncbi:MAG: hypothetical protein J7K58_02195 [Euryarchaeota archaeon]|nr:hypothetical protein [Euryarchaeota archaeon]
MIKWRPKGEKKPIEGTVNVSPYGLPEEIPDDAIIGEISEKRTCIYPFRPMNIDHRVVFFRQKYEVTFFEYENNPWKEFLEGLVQYFEDNLDREIVISLPTPWKAHQVARAINREFTGRIPATKIKVQGNIVSYGNNPEILVRYNLQSWGQRNLIKALWKLSLGEISALKIFLDNRPVDNLIMYTRDPEVLFKIIAWDKPLEELIKHDMVPKLQGNFFTIKLREKEIPVRDPTKPFDVEIWPLTSYDGKRVKIIGFRIIGTHVASFLRYYLMETRREFREMSIIARDWKNSKIIVRKITDVPVVRDKEFREAIVIFNEGKALDVDISLKEIKLEPKKKSMGVQEFLDEIPKEYHEFVLSFDLENPEKYSQRYSYILPAVKRDWDLAVSISRAIKARIFEKVVKHTIAHVLMSFLSFCNVLCVESKDIVGSIFVEENVKEENIRELYKLVKVILSECSCDEVCTGCAYSPLCLHENRYLDRILAVMSLD